MGQAMLIIDFETRSRCNLITRGSYVYAEHPSTEVVCCSFGLSEGNQDVWTYLNPAIYPRAKNSRANIMPAHIYEELYDPSVLLAAHNAGFDRLIWQLVAHNLAPTIFPVVPLEHWYCTSALCRVNALPASLDDATRAIDSKHRKNHSGSALIRKLSIPDKKTGEFSDDRGLLNDFAAYCEDDLHATRELVHHCRSLTQAEHEDWLINERINDRGVTVDRELARAAMRYAEVEQAAIKARLTELTDGWITSFSQSARIAAHLRDCIEAAGGSLEPMLRYKGDVKSYSADKSARAELLDLCHSGELDLPDAAVEVLELVDDGNRSSVVKFKTMLARTTAAEPRARGAFVYAGASQTLRFAARGLQLHNIRRDCFNQHDADDLLDRMQAGDELPDVMNTLSKMLRPSLVPEYDDGVFVSGDWSSIEAMGLPWLADSPGAEIKLDLYRQKVDVYTHTANAMGFDDRQIGKVCELSLGFGGGAGAFNAMARNYRVQLDSAAVTDAVTSWRRANGWAPDFWHALHKAARRAVGKPGTVFPAGRVSYLYVPELLEGTLLCLLPGNTVLQYPQTRVARTDRGDYEISAMKASWKPKADALEWPRITLWHGLLAENATQALCAAVLRDALRRCREASLPVVMHTHDEIVIEVDEAAAAYSEAALVEAMTSCDFVPGMPLRVDPVTCFRYGHKPA